MKKRNLNIWSAIRSWFKCTYIQTIKIVLYIVFIVLSVWALTVITQLKTTKMGFVTEGFALDSITITYDIDITQCPSRTFYKYDIIISHNYPFDRDLVKEILFVPSGLPSINDSLHIKRYYDSIEKWQQKKYDRNRFFINLLENLDEEFEPYKVPIENTVVEYQEDLSDVFHRKRFDRDSLFKTKNPLGLSALENMSYYYYPDQFINFISNNSIEFYGGLIHSYFNYWGKIYGFKENERLTGIKPCNSLIDTYQDYLYRMKIADTIDCKDLYMGFFNKRNYILHYEKQYKTNTHYIMESYHEYSPDKLSILSDLELCDLQNTIQRVTIWEPYYYLFYPYDLSKEFFEIDVDYTCDFLCSNNIEMIFNFDDYFHLLSSSISPTSIESDNMSFTIDSCSDFYSNNITVYVDYPTLQGIQNARVTLLTVLISILFSLVVAEIIRIIQIMHNRTKIKQMVAKNDFVCYGSASECLNCVVYDECNSTRYRFGQEEGMPKNAMKKKIKSETNYSKSYVRRKKHTARIDSKHRWF